MENPTIPNPQNPQQLNNVPVEQNISPKQKTSLLIPVLITLLISAIVFGGGGYYFGKLSSVTQPVTQYEQPTPTPVAINEPNVSPISDPTSQWQTYSDPSLNVQFKYPSTITVEKKQNLSASEGTPKEHIQVGQLLNISPYYNRVQTLWYTQNSELIQKTQEDLPAIKINGTDYLLSKANWEDGGPSQENCVNGTAQPNYFVDIPNKVSITISFQEIKSCGAFGEQIVQKGVAGVPMTDFDQQLQAVYQILSTLEFTN